MAVAGDLKKQVAGMSRADKFGAGFRSVQRDFEKLVNEAAEGNAQVTVQDLDIIRQRLGAAARFARGVQRASSRPTEGGEVVAGRFYNTVNAAIRGESSAIANAHDAASALRRLEQAVPPAQFKEFDETAMDAFFRKKGLKSRLSTAENVLTPRDWDRVKGWYFWKFIESASDPNTGELTVAGVKAAQRGKFGDNVFDRMLPGVRKELGELAAISDSMFRHKTGGRATLSRSPSPAEKNVGLANLGLPAGAFGVAFVLSDPSTAIKAALGAFGVGQAIKQIRGAAGRSALIGLRARNLDTAVREGTNPIGRGVAALSSLVPDQQ